MPVMSSVTYTGHLNLSSIYKEIFFEELLRFTTVYRRRRNRKFRYCIRKKGY